MVKAVLDLEQLRIQETLLSSWVASMDLGASVDAGMLGGWSPSMYGQLNSSI